jgi:hypothetical protein
MARRIFYTARQDKSLPKGLDDSLLGMHERRPFKYNSSEIQEFYEDVKDPSFRIQVNEDGIHIYNRDGIYINTNPFDLFPDLDLLQNDAPHAFYIGVELGRAQIAWQLGKNFMQDEELNWGVCSEKRSEEQRIGDLKTTHTMRELRRESNEYKSEGSTLKASRNKKKK